MNKLKIALKCCSIIGLLFFLSSFIGYDNGTFETPGTLTFIGDAGSPNLFTINRWEIENAKLPGGDFTQVKADILIDATSFTGDWKDLEYSIKKKKDYFYIKKFPKATVKINGAEQQDDGSYTTEASVTLKGKTKKVALTFTVSETPPYQVVGGGVIQRRQFNFSGDGQKEEVPVNFDFTFPTE
ncbi:MAG: YceI family protein [Bacteroidota bacterium]